MGLTLRFLVGLTMLDPDDFKNDPYGYVTNQISHIFLGFSLTTFYCFVIDKMSHYPDQTLSALIISGMYFIWWEILRQGWYGWDTIEDTAYVSLGASLFVFIDMSFVIERLTIFLFVLWVMLLFGALRRL